MKEGGSERAMEGEGREVYCRREKEQGRGEHNKHYCNCD